MSEDNKSLQPDEVDAPDILIQDLPDVEEDSVEILPEEPDNLCERCEGKIGKDERFCDDCIKEMSAYPIRKSVGIGVIATFLVCVFSVFLLGVNLLIVNPVLNGDICLSEGDIEGCYTQYNDAYSYALSMQKSLFGESSLSFFSVGTKTLCKQIVAVEKLNGAVEAGQFIDQFFPVSVPKELRAIKAEYDGIGGLVNGVNDAMSEYYESIKEGEADYDSAKKVLESTIEKHPEAPGYMKMYYRFSLAFSMSEDTSLPCVYLDKLIAMAPDELWLYASEGITAYKNASRYGDALSLCNKLLKISPSDPSVVAYTMSVMRLLGKYDEAMTVYNSFISVAQTTPEMERQKAVVLLLQGDSVSAQTVLSDSFSTQGATLQHLATLVICAYKNNDTVTFEKYKQILDGYAVFEQVEAFISGDITVEEIFLSGGGEIH